MGFIKISFVSFLLMTAIVAHPNIVPDSLINDESDSLCIELEPQGIFGVGDKFINAYGSYRINFGANTDGYFGMSDNASRFGIEGRIPVSERHGLEMFAVVELGTNLVDRDEIIVFRTDPGAEFTEEGNAVFSRLGFVGISGHYFDFSVGKQWSVYYDVAEFTDQFFAFGGEAAAAFNLGSDGGISGTGRANRLFLIRAKNIGPFNLGVQAQVRNLTSNNKSFADTYGASLRYEPNFGLMVGLSFNVVQDGIEDPKFNQPKKGDMAVIGAVGYINESFHVACSFSRFHNHEKLALNDSVDCYFSGYGMELFVGYSFSKDRKWRVATGFNYMQPDDAPEVGDYRLLYFIGELSYTFAKGSNVFTTVKFNRGSDRLGYIDSTSIIGMGFRFSFGY